METLEAWLDTGDITTGPVFRSVGNGARLSAAARSTPAIRVGPEFRLESPLSTRNHRADPDVRKIDYGIVAMMDRCVGSTQQKSITAASEISSTR